MEFGPVEKAVKGLLVFLAQPWFSTAMRERKIQAFFGLKWQRSCGIFTTDNL
jgi:hypothetical protein